MVRTYSGGSNYVIDSVLYEKMTNSTSTIRITGGAFIPATCTLNIGDSTSGLVGTLSEFRIFTGTGAIPGMPWVSSENCPQGAGIIAGTQDPCFDSCSDLHCIECSNTATCATCQQGLYLFVNGSALPSCLSNCPFGYINNNTIQGCTKCSSKGLLYYNASCVSSCPFESVVDSNLGGCVKCTKGLIYYNSICVASCPLTTFLDFSAHECRPCSWGCDTCTSDSKYDCTICSEGFFYLNGTCGAGCPSDKYADNTTRSCENCQPPCATCTQPNNLSCTSCSNKYYLLNGTCVKSCPLTHYLGFYGEYSLYRVPACIPKLILFFNLSLTSNARVVTINFNYEISDIILAISKRMQIQIGNAEISSEFYSLSPVSESTLKFEYVGGQYYAPFSLLNVTLDLALDFNTDEYQEYRTVNKSAYLQLKEIYPFKDAETQTIVASANLTSIGGGLTAAGQVLTVIATGAISVGLVRMQLISESIQLLRFIAIRWPPSVNQMFSFSTIDPTSIVIPLDLTTSWNRHLEDRNSTMPRVFQEYEVSPYFTMNYNNELSNIFIIGASIVSGIILIRLSKKVINKTQGTNKHLKSNTEVILDDDSQTDSPPRSTFRSLKLRFSSGLKRIKAKLIAIIHKLVLIISRLQEDGLWNFGLMFTLSIYQSGMLWSLVNLRNASTALENSTFFTNGTFTLAIFFLTIYSLLKLFLTLVVMKYPFNAKETLQQTYSNKYSTLFDDFESTKRIQIFFVPLLLLRSIIYMLILSLVWVSPLAQMIVTWITFLAFIAYMIVYQPIKSKWQRRMTLWIELMAFGCMTIGFICSIVDLTGDPDASTLNEIGFIVLAFNAGATIAGALTTLMQVLALVKLGYQYLRRRKQRRNAVQPINQLILPESQITVESAELKPISAQEKIKLFEAIDSLYKANSDKSAEAQFLEDRQHWKSTGKLKSAKNTGTSNGKISSLAERKFEVIGYSESSTPKIG